MSVESPPRLRPALNPAEGRRAGVTTPIGRVAKLHWRSAARVRSSSTSRTSSQVACPLSLLAGLAIDGNMCVIHEAVALDPDVQWVPQINGYDSVHSGPYPKPRLRRGGVRLTRLSQAQVDQPRLTNVVRGEPDL
jgi:hypothetical protein